MTVYVASYKGHDIIHNHDISYRNIISFCIRFTIYQDVHMYVFIPYLYVQACSRFCKVLREFLLEMHYIN